MIGWMILFASLAGQAADSAATPHYYMGQEPPGLVPQVFAPGFISLANRHESFITFTPDGNECYFTVHQTDWAPYWIMMTVYRDGAWTTPQRAPFTNDSSLCPDISSDGTKLSFCSNRGTPGGAGVWQCLRTADGDWSTPVEMDRQISSGSMEFSCHLSDLGNMFVCSWRAGGQGGCDGWRIPCVNGHFQQAENLKTLNSSVGDCGFAPGPREAYLIFQSRRPPTGNGGGFFGTDLYISFALPEGGWTPPRNLGPTINSSATDGFAWISHDGRYLFFSSDRQGTDDIYWVSVKAFLPDPNGLVSNLTTGKRFDCIQAAVNYAEPGQVILLSPGTYNENLILPDIPLTIRSTNSLDSAVVSRTILCGDKGSPVVRLMPGYRPSVLAGADDHRRGGRQRRFRRPVAGELFCIAEDISIVSIGHRNSVEQRTTISARQFQYREADAWHFAMPFFLSVFLKCGKHRRRILRRKIPLHHSLDISIADLWDRLFHLLMPNATSLP
jgi:hypothetical protein